MSVKRIILIWLGIGLLLTFQAGVYNLLREQDPNWVQFSFYYFSSSVIWILLFYPLTVLVSRFPVIGKSRVQHLLVLLFAGLLISFIQRLFTILLDFSIRYLVGDMDNVFSNMFSVRHVILSTTVDSFMIYVILVFLLLLIRRRAGDYGREQEFILIRDKNKSRKIRVSEINLITSRKNYVEINTGSKNFQHRQSLSHILKQLPKNFRRIHRSHIINMDAIVEWQHLYNGVYSMKLRGGEFVTSSESYRQDFSEIRLELEKSVPN